MMKKVLIYLAALAMLTACGSDIEYTEPDNKTDQIQFSVASIDAPATGMAKVVSRAEHGHEAWNDAKHANTLGVFGYCDGLINNDHEIFKNQKVTPNIGETPIKWEYTPAKYWAEFTQYSSFDFFGYMVENADPSTADLPAATITKDGSNFTLSFPASLTSPILTSPNNTPLICHAPQHTTVVGMPIPFQMDQTLTGYDIQFQLGAKMSNLRYFVIKSVKVYGANMPVGGKVSRTYTLTGDTWTADNVTWSDVTTESIAAGEAIPLAPEWPTNANVADRTISAVNNTTWVKWGDSDLGKGAFYIIPYASSTPTIEVTYDVYTDADANGEGGTLSRKDVKSTIILNKANFDALASTTGEIQHINIKIVPDYLYVLSDDDQVTGFLIATE